MDDNKAYYIAAGESLEAIEKIQLQRQRCHERRREFGDRFGATAMATNRESLSGLIFDPPAKPPDGWKNIACNGTKNCYRPSRRSKAMKEICREMASLRWAPNAGYAAETRLGRIRFCSSNER
jgi:hypothetical protein